MVMHACHRTLSLLCAKPWVLSLLLSIYETPWLQAVVLEYGDVLSGT